MTKAKKLEAVEKYGKLKAAGANLAEIKDAISADPEGFKPKEIDQILAEIETPGGSNGSGPGNGSGKKADDLGANKIYQEFRVEPKYKTLKDKFSGKEIRELTGFDKETMIRDNVRITPDRAELENAQSEQTKTRYYLKGE